jgi:hypothetical protein
MPSGEFARALAGFGLLALAGQAVPAGAQAVGPEFRVNAYTTGDQGARGPGSVAALPDGRRFDSAGLPLGPEFQVNSYTTGWQRVPAVAAAGDGRLAVVWQSNGQDGSSYGVFGQRYDAQGAPTGEEFQANTHTTLAQREAAVAAAPNGRFVVVWASAQDGSQWGVFGQPYSSTGAPLGPEFQVNSYTTGSQVGPAVAAVSGPRFVATWESEAHDGSGYGVSGRRLQLDLIFANGFDAP